MKRRFGPGPGTAGWLALTAIALTFSPDLVAHGGRYVGSGAPPPPTGPPPPTPGTIAGRVSVPLGTNPFRGPAPPAAAGVTETIEDWWEFNWEWFLDLRTRAGHVRGDGTSSSFRVATAVNLEVNLLPVLLREAQHKSSEVRSAAVLALGKTGLAAAFDGLRRASRDRHADVREAALVGMGMIRHPMAQKELLRQMQDPLLRPRERAFAAAGLGLLGTQTAAETLIQTLEKDLIGRSGAKRSIAIAAVLGLAASGCERVAPRLIEWFAKERLTDHVLRAVACSALGRLGGRSSLPTLMKALEDNHGVVRKAAALALGLVAQPDDTGVIKALFHAAREESQVGAKAFAYLSLGRIGGPDVLHSLRRDIKEDRYGSSGLIRPYAVLALGLCGDSDRDGKRLTLLFQKKRDIPTRLSAALALAKLQYKPAQGILLAEMLRAKNDRLWSFLAIATGMLETERARKSLHRTLVTERREARLVTASSALAVMRDPQLTNALKKRLERERSSSIRAALVTSMGTIGDARHIPTLTQLLEGKQRRRVNDMLRTFVVTALGRIGDRNGLPIVSRLSRDMLFPIDDDVVTELMGLL